MRAGFFGLALATALAGVTSAVSGADFDEAAAVARGGVFYDSWFAALEKPAPTATHPAYPSAGRQTGAATWRCRECHGWDYKGAAGVNASGSRFTGIKGIDAMAGKDPGEIAKIIRDNVHRYTPDLLSDSAVAKLALFVSKGQIDMDLVIDRKSGKALGDSTRGVQQYRLACFACHGGDGTRINFSSGPAPEYLGTVANSNPWSVMHRMRNGLPEAAMLGLAGLSTLSAADQANLLAYLQTLPVK
ncbi:MAG: c-type cytochrome [Bauldia sp.]